MRAIAVRIISTFFLVLTALTGAAYSQEAVISPPFGMKWDDSKESVLAKYPSAVSEVDGDLTLITIAGNESNEFPSNTDFVRLIYADGYGLVKVSWVSEDVKSDLYGTDGVEAFDRIYIALSKKLGAGKEIKRVGMELYKDPDEFYECLEYDGCGVWATFWNGTESSNSASMLKLNGLGRGEGYVSYSVEHPNWYKRNDQAEENDASKF
jgi:hypothetical protein